MTQDQSRSKRVWSFFPYETNVLFLFGSLKIGNILFSFELLPFILSRRMIFTLFTIFHGNYS